MLVPKQWSRIVGGVVAAVVAAVVFLVLLKWSHEHYSLREVFHIPTSKFAALKPEPMASYREISIKPSPYSRTIEPTKPSFAPDPTTLQAEVATIPTPTKVSGDFGLPEPLIHKESSLIAKSNPARSSSTARPNSTSSPSSYPRKTIVMGKISSEDTDWVGQELTDWQSSIYVVDLPKDVDSPTGLKTKMNKANEATPYLTYIIEHYDDLPDIAVFLHAHRTSWHNDGPKWDVVSMLRGLHLSVVEQRGFVNLRCMGSPGCPNEIQLNRSPVNEDLTAEIAFPSVYGEYFNMTVEEVREQVPIIATPCCAQFAVSRTQVLKRPKSDYERLLQLVEDSNVDSHVLGTVLEYMWHIIFGKDPVHCEQETVCRDALYGYGNPADWV